ncbi:1,5-anhydro-D-fructose reductase-like isoform X4 [Diabrotica virgifera virgifera]|uniref:NADP-dependent oxidoreductase domain-containing protein n=1 Tax=Diabrotica virgifera virgifera TaxID=50390 RepID=A0ABM5KJA2_DIAVI|nr:1,5-anhydro-D-fructose reductase-like isoform X4 [Diabrotica virgifera virgifera]
MSLTMIGGVKIPIVGLGTWQATNEEELEAAVEAALETGYRHIDTAAAYQNEHVIGKVLNKWLTSGKLKREDIFITTKLPFTHIHPDMVESALKESLKKLQLDYVDLYLVHFPVHIKVIEPGKPLETLPTDHLAVWKKMEEQVDAKRTRTIGLSNFSVKQIDRIVKNCRIQPVNTQVELHVYFQQKKLRDYCKNHNIVVVSYGSLGSPGLNNMYKRFGGDVEVPSLLADPVVTRIAEKHNRPTSHVLLRYLTQNDIVVIPKSVKPERVRQNFNFSDFTLDAEDLKALEGLDKEEKGRLFNMNLLMPTLKDHPEYPYES